MRFAQATGTHAEGVPRPSSWPNRCLPRAVRQGPYKLIQWPWTGEEALYDLETDPGERRNLLDTKNDVPADLVETLQRLRPALESWARSADPLPSHFDREFELDTRRKLCALGYVDCPESESDLSEGSETGTPTDPKAPNMSSPEDASADLEVCRAPKAEEPSRHER